MSVSVWNALSFWGFLPHKPSSIWLASPLKVYRWQSYGLLFLGPLPPTHHEPGSLWDDLIFQQVFWRSHFILSFFEKINQKNLLTESGISAKYECVAWKRLGNPHTCCMNIQYYYFTSMFTFWSSIIPSLPLVKICLLLAAEHWAKTGSWIVEVPPQQQAMVLCHMDLCNQWKCWQSFLFLADDELLKC